LAAEHHPLNVKCYFSLVHCVVWERGNDDKQRQAMLYNEKAHELLRESFETTLETGKPFLRMVKVVLNQFKYQARSLKMEEALKTYKKYEQMLLECLNNDN